MNATELLKTKYGGFGNGGAMMLAYTSEQVDAIRAALLQGEADAKELAEIKERAEATKKEYDRGVLWQNEVCEDIDFIIKGEGK